MKSKAINVAGIITVLAILVLVCAIIIPAAGRIQARSEVVKPMAEYTISGRTSGGKYLTFKVNANYVDFKKHSDSTITGLIGGEIAGTRRNVMIKLKEGGHASVISAIKRELTDVKVTATDRRQIHER